MEEPQMKVIDTTDLVKDLKSFIKELVVAERKVAVQNYKDEMFIP